MHYRVRVAGPGRVLGAWSPPGISKNLKPVANSRALVTPRLKYLIFDNDAIFSSEVSRPIARFVIHPRRAALENPWQNGPGERFVGRVRRELLDHVVVLRQNHLRRLLREFIDYYNSERVHTSIGDAPEDRAVQYSPRIRPRSLAGSAW